MVSNSNDWEQLTIIRLNESNNKLKDAQNTLEKAQHAIEHWQKYVKALENVLELAKHPVSGQISPDEVEKVFGGSTWDNLKIVMNGSKGILSVQEAVSFLVHVKFFTDREHARNVIYSTLNAHANDVVKISPGVYRLIEVGDMKPLIKDDGNNQKVVKKKVVNKQYVPRRMRVNNHVSEVVEAAKKLHPEWNGKEITDELIKNGFDFQGKRPISSVNISLARLKKQLHVSQVIVGVPSVQGIVKVDGISNPS